MEAEALQRLSVPALDEILGKKFKVLDDGFIRLIDYMGDDSSIVQAARVSYGKGTKKVSEDEGLIRFLMRHGHTTPLEMCVLKIHVRVPMDCWRQWIRHRTASVNEYSTRYSEAIDRCQETKIMEWRTQSSNNKQGSLGIVNDYPDGYFDVGKVMCPGEYLSNREAEFQRDARELYKERLEFGVAREQARKDLPLSNYTEAYWEINLHNLLHFLGLRMDSHAQKEIRDYATIIGEEIVAKWVPITWQAFNDYHILRGAIKLTSRDIHIIKSINHHANIIAKEFGWLRYKKKLDDCPKCEGGHILCDDPNIPDNRTHIECWYCNRTGKIKVLKNNRERQECEEKLKMLGLEIPWQKNE